MLVEGSDPIADPEGLIPNFARHECMRLHPDRFEDKISGTLQDRLAVLVWYLSDYMRDQRYNRSPPLSARQIIYLNGPYSPGGAVVGRDDRILQCHRAGPT